VNHYRKDPPTQQEAKSFIKLTVFLGIGFLLLIIFIGWLSTQAAQWIFDL